MLTSKTKLRPEEVIIYLRKSRKDDPNESVEEVLSKHETSLQEYAVREFGGPVPPANVYKEIGSAESIEGRVEIKNVLARIEDPDIRGCLVVDATRISRGDLGDCHRVIMSFQLSGTLVITPMMVYDLSKKMERKFFQDELLRGRDFYEYMREIQWMGRVRSAKRGAFIAGHAPFGYTKIKHGKIATLEPNDDADLVRLIFHKYTQEGESIRGIARYLNSQQIPSAEGGLWAASTVRKILTNPHYTGVVVYNRRKTVEVLESGQIIKKREKAPEDELIIADGVHPAIIDADTFELAQNRVLTNPRVKKQHKLVNPLAGILYCSKCGRVMDLRFNCEATLSRFRCSGVSQCFRTAPAVKVVEALLFSLENSELPDLRVKLQNDDGNARKIQQSIVDKLQKQLAALLGQEEKQFELLETGTYTTEVFERRHNDLREKIDACEEAIETARATMPEFVDYAERIVSLESAIAALRSDDMTSEEKNKILKSIIKRVEFTGEPHDGTDQRGKKPAETFTLEVFLRL